MRKNAALFALAALVAGAAAAREVGSIAGNGAGIVLFDDRRDCPEGTASALYLDANGPVRGCWFDLHDHVWMWFQDGDTYGVPKSRVTYK
jgi:hypothetical protein